MGRPKKNGASGEAAEPDMSQAAIDAARSGNPESLLKPGWDGSRDFHHEELDDADLGVGASEETSAPFEADEAFVRAAAREIAVKTLTGDLRDFILNKLRHEQNKRPWHERSEAEQNDTVHQVEAAVQANVTRAVELIAGHGRRTVRAVLESATVKDGIKAVLVLSRADEQRHALIDSVGAKVTIIVADPEEFTGERAPVSIKPDQGDLDRLAKSGVVHSAAEDNHDTATPLN